MNVDRSLFNLASRLVAFDSVSVNSNITAAEWIASELEARGCVAILHRYEDFRGVAKANVVARVGPPEPDGLLISGHIDTVPYADQAGWSRDALRLVVDGDRLYGRGIADMKGFIADCIYAAGRIDRRALRRPLVFAFTADEEIGCLGAAHLADHIRTFLDETPLPRLAGVGDPTSYRIHHAHKSAVLFSIRVFGKSGHSGRPDLGVSAIVLAGRVVALLEDIDRELCAAASRADVFGDVPHATLNVGTIRGGTAPNVIAGECEIGVLYRSLPGDDPLTIHRDILHRLAGIDLRDRPEAPEIGRIEVSTPVVVPPMESPKGTELERVLRDLTARGEPTGSLLAADGCRFEPLGVQTLICGPGEFEQAHQPDESMLITDLVSGAVLVERVVDRICGAGSG
jgi:acetylornithine deacetylase